ncbi:hypothetical protein LINGRAPRIM_LOCUS1284 [Linum grandiflorum]
MDTVVVGRYSRGFLTTILAIIVVTGSLVLSPSQVYGDVRLKASVCAKTPWEAVCNMCFDSNKEITDGEDIRGLGGSSINCALEKAIVVRQYFGYAKDESGNCYACLDIVDSAIEKILASLQRWYAFDYAESKTQLDLSREDGQTFSLTWNDCEPLHDDTIYQIMLWNRFTEVAPSVVSQI